MSKYTEAETKIKKIMREEIDRLPSHFDGEDEVYDSAKDVDEILKLNKTVCKALQIADKVRFEVEWLIDCEIANNGFLKASDAETFAKSIVDFVLAQNEESGKRLADIRGDNNDCY